MPNEAGEKPQRTTELDMQTVKKLVRMPLGNVNAQTLLETVLPVLRAEGVQGVARVAAITYTAQRLWIEDLRKQLRTAQEARNNG